MTTPKGWTGRWHEVPEGVTDSLPQSPVGDSPLVRGGHYKRFFDSLAALLKTASFFIFLILNFSFFIFN
jgi:hypothetical protein